MKQFDRHPEIGTTPFPDVVCSQAAGYLLAFFFCLTTAGCVSKSEARLQAQRAYLAGQRAAQLQNQQAPQESDISFVGEVNHPVVTWVDGLTLAQAIVAADYSGRRPSRIVIRRGNDEILISPLRLLNGEDFPLEPGDIVEMRP